MYCFKKLGLRWWDTQKELFLQNTFLYINKNWVLLIMLRELEKFKNERLNSILKMILYC